MPVFFSVPYSGQALRNQSMVCFMVFPMKYGILQKWRMYSTELGCWRTVISTLHMPLFWTPLLYWSLIIISWCQFSGIMTWHNLSDRLVDVLSSSGKGINCRFHMKLWEILLLWSRGQLQSVNAFLNWSLKIVINLFIVIKCSFFHHWLVLNPSVKHLPEPSISVCKVLGSFSQIRSRL